MHGLRWTPQPFDWELLAAPFSDGKLTGDAKVLYKADKNWDPAPFACGDDKVVWLVQPASSGEKPVNLLTATCGV